MLYTTQQAPRGTVSWVHAADMLTATTHRIVKYVIIPWHINFSHKWLFFSPYFKPRGIADDIRGAGARETVEFVACCPPPYSFLCSVVRSSMEYEQPSLGEKTASRRNTTLMWWDRDPRELYGIPMFILWSSLLTEAPTVDCKEQH